jgi:hypothetical protein
MSARASVRLVALASAVSCSCGGGPLFQDAPTVWQVDDQRNIAEPHERKFNRTEYYARIYFAEQADRALRLPDEEPAWNTNSHDEVPDSTWFQNRIGARIVKPAEAARGSLQGPPPQPPFQIVSGKIGGGTPGVLIKDRLGRKFLVKRDTRANPELHSAAGAIVNRIFWTLGYNVPEDQVFELRRDQLHIEPGATYKDALGDKVPFTEANVDAILAHGPPPNQGAYRALASRLLDGKPMGGFPKEGTRADDANDRVPHQHRRELRGLRVFAAWVGHTDMKEDNTLDMFVEQGNAHFLRHYLVDFDAALNEHAVEMDRPEDGWEYFVDWRAQTKATLAFGLWKRPWEDVTPTPWPSVGSFSAQPFAPRAWRETYPYAPFAEMDDADAYWAAKLVMRFDRPLLEAIVEQGRLSAPVAAHYLVDTLLARRDAIGREFLQAVTPLDDFALERGTMCMTDLAVHHRLAPPGVIEWLSGSRVLTARAENTDGRICVTLPTTEAYRIFRIRVRRRATSAPPMELHFKGGPHARLLGVVRVAR